MLALSIPVAAALADSSDTKDSPDETLNIAFPATSISFNPIHAVTSTESELYTALYEGLVTYNPFTLEPLPGVAQSWDVSNDGTVYTFHLRDDAAYWNGQPITASDFRDTWLHVLDPKVKAEYSFMLDSVVGAKSYRLGKSTDPDTVGIKVIDPYTLQVTLENPAPQFLKILCHYSFVPIPQSYLKKESWSSEDAIPGNGPFYVLKHSRTEIDLTKNNLYWDADAVHVQNIKIHLTDNADLTTQQFNGGVIQWATGEVNWDKVNKTNAIIVNPLFATSYYYFNASKAPWSNPDIRRAFALLLPWSQIREKSELYIPASTLVPKIDAYPDVSGIEDPDPTAALSLLKQAGFANGTGLPPITILIPDEPESKRIAGLMQAAWQKALDVVVNVKTVPYSQYYQRVDDMDFTLATTTWIGDFADPLTFLQMWTSDSNLNAGNYQNSIYDDLVKKSMTGSTDEQRYKTLAQAETLLIQGAEVLPIDHAPALNLIDLHEIAGWFPNALDIHPFKYLEYRTPGPIPGVTDREQTGGVLLAQSGTRP